jgi:hypothetical protein
MELAVLDYTFLLLSAHFSTFFAVARITNIKFFFNKKSPSWCLLQLWGGVMLRCFFFKTGAFPYFGTVPAYSLL